jgi:hypothetical protein
MVATFISATLRIDRFASSRSGVAASKGKMTCPLEILFNLGKRTGDAGIDEGQSISSLNHIDPPQTQTLYGRNSVENMVHTFLLPEMHVHASQDYCIATRTV